MAPPILTVSGRTAPGRVRSENQDAFRATDLSEAPAGPPSIEGPDPGTGAAAGTLACPPGSQGVLLLVADGVGGTRGGAVASRLAGSAVTEAMQRAAGAGAPPDADDAERRLHDAVIEADRRIRAGGDASPEHRGMATTVTAALVFEGFVLVAQVGDSRCYLFREGRLIPLTRDQSVVQELIEAGAITSEQARTNPQRNLILQALGSASDLEVALSRSELRGGDQLLLCSDGLWGLVEAEEISELLRGAANPEAACEELVARANEQGGTDNITALVARLA